MQKKLINNSSKYKQVSGYLIQSPDCGRDKNGQFYCKCGKCKPLMKTRQN